MGDAVGVAVGNAVGVAVGVAVGNAVGDGVGDGVAVGGGVAEGAVVSSTIAAGAPAACPRFPDRGAAQPARISVGKRNNSLRRPASTHERMFRKYVTDQYPRISMSTAAASTRKKVMNRPAMNSVDKSVIAILPGSSGQPLDNSTFQPEIANFVALP